MVFKSSMSAWIFFVRLLLFWSGRLGMTETRLLNGVRKATEIIPARRDVHQLTQGRFNPVRDLLACPFPLVVWR